MPPPDQQNQPPVDWPSVGYAAAAALLGPPNSRLTRADGDSARWGRKGSFWLKRRTGFWHDFENDQHGDVLDLITRETGKDRKAAYQWLQEQGLLTLALTEVQPQPPEGRDQERASPEFLQELWNQSLPIVPDRIHPARRWLARRQLWPPRQETPPGLAWKPYAFPRRETGCCGRVIALLATPDRWRELAETQELPQPQALQAIAIGYNGEPRLDKPYDEGGLDKRTFGSSQDAVYWLGERSAPHLIRVAEGIADALALASRAAGAQEAIIATTGSGNWHRSNLAKQLAALAAPIVLHPDNDKAGHLAAEILTQHLQELDCQVETAPAGPPGWDPADLARLDPFSRHSEPANR